MVRERQAHRGNRVGAAMSSRILPDRDELERRIRAGQTHAQIAEEFGVTVQSVHNRRVLDDNTNPQPSYRDQIPWAVAREHRASSVARHLRAIKKVRDGVEIPEQERRWLDNWLQKLKENNWVVGYDRRVKSGDPRAAVPSGGWFYTKRSPDDDEWPSVITLRDIDGRFRTIEEVSRKGSAS